MEVGTYFNYGTLLYISLEVASLGSGGMHEKRLPEFGST